MAPTYRDLDKQYSTYFKDGFELDGFRLECVYNSAKKIAGSQPAPSSALVHKATSKVQIHKNRVSASHDQKLEIAKCLVANIKLDNSLKSNKVGLLVVTPKTRYGHAQVEVFNPLKLDKLSHMVDVEAVHTYGPLELRAISNCKLNRHYFPAKFNITTLRSVFNNKRTRIQLEHNGKSTATLECVKALPHDFIAGTKLVANTDQKQITSKEAALVYSSYSEREQEIKPPKSENSDQKAPITKMVTKLDWRALFITNFENECKFTMFNQIHKNLSLMAAASTKPSTTTESGFSTALSLGCIRKHSAAASSQMRVSTDGTLGFSCTTKVQALAYFLRNSRLTVSVETCALDHQLQRTRIGAALKFSL